MDILEQHLEPQDISTVNIKQDDSASMVIEETEIVDCDASYFTEVARDEELRYQEALTYRVVQVNGATTANEIDVPVPQGSNTVQVLTSPLNGQFYVIGTANDVLTTAQTSRSLAPRATSLQIETTRGATGGIKKRDDRRRATHNEVERRRRDKINNWIAKLGKIIPECNNTNGSGNANSVEGKANYETQSKGGILAKACEYINELRTANQGLGQCLRDNEKLRQEVVALKQVITQLKRENMQLRSQISTNPTTNTESVRLSP